MRSNNNDINNTYPNETESKSESQSQTDIDNTDKKPKEQKKETTNINVSDNNNKLVSQINNSKQNDYNIYEKIIKENIELN